MTIPYPTPGYLYQPVPAFDPRRTILSGMSTADMQLALKNAQTAYIELMTGASEVSVAYDGKSVTYNSANSAGLQNLIYLLQRQLGISPGRLALRPIFR